MILISVIFESARSRVMTLLLFKILYYSIRTVIKATA